MLKDSTEKDGFLELKLSENCKNLSVTSTISQYFSLKDKNTSCCGLFSKLYI